MNYPLLVEFVPGTRLHRESERRSDLPIHRNGPPGTFVVFPHLRVSLPEGSALYPEISGSQHRFTIRFLEWSSVDRRAVQTGHDVSFKLSIC